jgi:hypothetical protein
MKHSRQACWIIGSLSGMLSTLAAKPYSLIESSPFIPPDFNPPSANVPARTPRQQEAAYSYQGVYQIGDTFFFNILNRSEDKGEWVRSDVESVSGIQVVGFDLEANEIEIEVDGLPISLSMVEPSDTPIPVQTAPAAATRPAPAVTNRPTVTRPDSSNRPVRRRVIRPSTRTNPSVTSSARRPVTRQ